MKSVKVGILLSYICIASISSSMITPALPNIEQAFALSHGALEWVISIFLVGYVLGQLVYAPLANRFGRLAALRAGLVINLIGTVFCIGAIWMSSYTELLIGRFITALGAAAGLTCTFMLINELLPQDKAQKAMSYAVVSFTLGVGIAVTLGGLITQYLHWSYCFELLLLHGVVMLLCTWLYDETLVQRLPLKPDVIIKGYFDAFKNKQLLGFSVTVGLASSIGYCYAGATPIYAQTVLNLNAAEYGYWNLINMIGMLGSGFLGAYTIKKIGPKALLMTGLVLLLPCLIMLYIELKFIPTPLLFFTTTMLLYLFSGLIFPAASFFASNAIADRATASSAMSFVNMATATLSVVVMGYLPLTNIQAFVATIAALYLVSFIAVIFLKSKV